MQAGGAGRAPLEALDPGAFAAGRSWAPGEQFDVGSETGEEKESKINKLIKKKTCFPPFLAAPTPAACVCAISRA